MGSPTRSLNHPQLVDLPQFARFSLSEERRRPDLIEFPKFHWEFWQFIAPRRSRLLLIYAARNGFERASRREQQFASLEVAALRWYSIAYPDLVIHR